ncbi:peptidylprolyl isomerase [Proteinivorax hydrogeniformans]|uniref:Peptidylprolyl isomerase n=1 Tax=Proteinivorax hydrogeniformans TaxID=1826727 RepID=A0AAU8HTB1_9FIRM
MLRKKITAMTALVLTVIMLAGCFSGDGNVVAVVGDMEITREELEREIALRYKIFGQQQGLPKDAKADFLEQLINQELLYQEALNQGVTPDKEDVIKRYEMIENDLINQIYESESAFIRTLEEYGATTSDFKEVIEKIVTVEGLISKTDGELERVTSEEIEEFYNQNIQAFAESDKRKIRHILVGSESQANAIITRITEREEDFEELAMEFSTCPSGENGGNLGLIPPDGLDGEFADAAFSMEVGTLNESPVNSSFGWHIIEVLDEEKGYVRELDGEVKNQITNHIMQQRSKQAEADLINRLRQEVDVKNRLND